MFFMLNRRANHLTESEEALLHFSIRNLDEVEVYFTNLTPEYRFRLVDKLFTFAIIQGS
jgi:hypothetical protein